LVSDKTITDNRNSVFETGKILCLDLYGELFCTCRAVPLLVSETMFNNTD
jgi:hypothetical protein